MTASDNVYIVAEIGSSGASLLKRNGVVKAVCKTPRDAITAFNPSLRKVSVRIPEQDRSGITIFETPSRGDIIVIDLACLHSTQCQAQS